MARVEVAAAVTELMFVTAVLFVKLLPTLPALPTRSSYRRVRGRRATSRLAFSTCAARTLVCCTWGVGLASLILEFEKEDLPWLPWLP